MEQVNLARVALRRLNLVDKGNERDRRPSEDELNRIIRLHDDNPRQTIALDRTILSGWQWRIARAIADMALVRADHTKNRFSATVKTHAPNQAIIRRSPCSTQRLRRTRVAERIRVAPDALRNTGIGPDGG